MTLTGCCIKLNAHFNIAGSLNQHASNIGRNVPSNHIPYNGIFSCRQIFAVLSQKRGNYFSWILIFAVGNVRKKQF